MLRLKSVGGDRVDSGSYWNFTTGERVHVDGSALLPGDDGTTYFRLPPIVMLALAPVLGLVYALFLPFIGLAMAIGFVAGRLAIGVRNVAVAAFEAVWRVSTFGWRPSEAYFAGRKKKGAKAKKEEEEPKEQ